MGGIGDDKLGQKCKVLGVGCGITSICIAPKNILTTFNCGKNINYSDSLSSTKRSKKSHLHFSYFTTKVANVDKLSVQSLLLLFSKAANKNSPHIHV